VGCLGTGQWALAQDHGSIPLTTQSRPAARSRQAYPWVYPVTGLGSHGHGSTVIRMAELAMRAGLPVDTPAAAIKDLSNLSHLQDLSLRAACDIQLRPACSRRLGGRTLRRRPW
jgi:hypothetical protein